MGETTRLGVLLFGSLAVCAQLCAEFGRIFSVAVPDGSLAALSSTRSITGPSLHRGLVFDESRGDFLYPDPLARAGIALLSHQRLALCRNHPAGYAFTPGDYVYYMEKPSEERVSAGYGIHEKFGEFVPGDASVSFLGREVRLPDNRVVQTLDIKIVLKDSTIAVSASSTSRVRNHEEYHMLLTNEAYDSIRERLAGVTSVTYDSVEARDAAATSPEGKAVLVAAAELAAARCNLANLKLDYDDPLNDEVTRQDVVRAEAGMDEVEMALNRAIEAFRRKFAPLRSEADAFDHTAD